VAAGRSPDWPPIAGHPDQTIYFDPLISLQGSNAILHEKPRLSFVDRQLAFVPDLHWNVALHMLIIRAVY